MDGAFRPAGPYTLHPLQRIHAPLAPHTRMEATGYDLVHSCGEQQPLKNMGEFIKRNGVVGTVAGRDHVDRRCR